jgi:hypothetical protein
MEDEMCSQSEDPSLTQAMFEEKTVTGIHPTALAFDSEEASVLGTLPILIKGSSNPAARERLTEE